MASIALFCGPPSSRPATIAEPGSTEKAAGKSAIQPKKVASTLTLFKVCLTSPRVLLIFAEQALLNPLFNFSYRRPSDPPTNTAFVLTTTCDLDLHIDIIDCILPYI